MKLCFSGITSILTIFVLLAVPSGLDAQIFTNFDAGVRGLGNGGVVVWDFDGDGNMDLLMEGQNVNGAWTTVWQNPGNGPFADFLELTDAFFGSVAVGDFFNDGQLDAVVTSVGGGPHTQFLQNLGNGYFNLVTNSGLPGVINSFVAVGDFDNDGKADIVLSGSTNSNGAGLPLSQLWRNTGNGVFTKVSSGINRDLGALFIGDFDNDGYLDILKGGSLWRNVGNGTFTNFPSGLPGNVLAVADFDNDGYLDVLVGDSASCQVWRNQGNATFTNWATIHFSPSAVAAGDYDNDGNVDILIQTIANSRSYLQVWRNLGQGTFTNTYTVTNVPMSSMLAWADFNRDGRLDMFISGLSGQNAQGELTYSSMMYLNNSGCPSNSPPTAPTNLTAQITGNNGVRLNWNAATDDHTLSSGLNYNIRVGTSSGGLDIVSPQSDISTGQRRVVAIGNAQERLFSIITNLTGGTYYWSVQAIDTAFAGGAFATEATFTVPPTITGFNYPTNSQFQVTFNALAGNSYSLFASSDLTNWNSIANVVPFSGGPATLTDTNTFQYPLRYYRLSCP